MENSVGPFTVVDADTGIPMRRNKFTKLHHAFSWAYKTCEKGQDFVVLDRQLQPVRRTNGNI